MIGPFPQSNRPARPEPTGQPETSQDEAREDRSPQPVRALVCARPHIAQPLGETLQETGWEIHRVDTPHDLKAARRRVEPGVIVVDAALPLPDAALQSPDSEEKHRALAAWLVETYSPETLTRAFRQGASTVFRWPDDLDHLMRSVEQQRRRPGKAAGPPSIDVPVLVGRSKAMESITERLVHASPSDANVLVTGESGTGKELVARAIHRLSPRRAGPFVAVNCGAIPEKLIESELFGHEEGAFTDAINTRQGRFELADGGTLFLDEIAELSDAMQVKLLRVLQEDSFQRVGGNESIEVDVRVIAATNRTLSPRPSSSQPLRQDLFFRLNVLRIDAPRLIDRKEDIEPLWEHFLAEAARQEARPELEADPEVVDRLSSHDWPGNVRELRNVARHAVAMATGGGLTTDCLPAYLRDEQEDQERSPLVGQTLEELERAAIRQTCEATDTVKQAANLLGVSERTIYYRKKKYRDDE